MMFRTVLLLSICATGVTADDQLRPATSEQSLKQWLQNMVWHHRYTDEEVRRVTGLSADELQEKLSQFGITDSTRPQPPGDRLFVLPYPGGRHPRIGFLDGAIEPQRETKLSVFCPWDDRSYVVLDVPEAIWSNLGLTYLAHTHIDTVWTKQGIKLPKLEWQQADDGSLVMQRRLPNGIEFGTRATPARDHVAMEMWLRNGTDKPLSDLRVQNCAMLKSAKGFARQTNQNKQFDHGYAIARSQDMRRWIITAWDPVHRPWANEKCPCLHSDPKFPDCAPGETKRLRGWFSFYEGDDIKAEISRIEATGWRHPAAAIGNVQGRVTDVVTGSVIPSRLYVRNATTNEWHFALSKGGSAVRYDKQLGSSASIERHTTLSAHPFHLQLPPGTYDLQAVHGKEFLPARKRIQITDSQEPVTVDLRLRRFANMAARGWYSGDTHVHRSLDELPNVVVAEDLNVALPLTQWVRDSTQIPAATGPKHDPKPTYVDKTHVIYPVNTEYEIFSIKRKRHTQGAVFVLNHKSPLRLQAPPTVPIAEEARRQGALLDLDKHSWNWSLMIVPTMKVDLFELTNNHHWRTQFGFPKWTLDNAPDWPEIERTDAGFTEDGWTHFGLETYYSLLNCGFRMRVSGGTASGVHPVPLGHGRVYVHCGKTFDYQTWITNLNAGHSFVTQGPLLDIRFNGQLPGQSVRSRSSEHAIAVTGTIDSALPLKSVQLICNGEVVSTIDPQQQKTRAGSFRTTVEILHKIRGSAWLALRCFEKVPGNKVSFAHTNPHFIDVEERPVRPRRSRVQYFVQRMEAEIARNQDILSPESVAEFRKARDVYQRLLRTAR